MIEKPTPDTVFELLREHTFTDEHGVLKFDWDYLIKEWDAEAIVAAWEYDRYCLATVTAQRDALVPLFEAVEWARLDDDQADAVLDAVRAIRAERATIGGTDD
jgi:hypothetical protein